MPIDYAAQYNLPSAFAQPAPLKPAAPANTSYSSILPSGGAPATSAIPGARTATGGAAKATSPLMPSLSMPTAFAPTSPFAPPAPPPPPTQAPGNNMVNPGYTEQAFDHVQNRLLEDPSQGLLQNQYQQTQAPSTGEQFLNQNLGTLSGPGEGDQYWNQVQGQFMNPMGGEQFARQATQQFQQQGPASAFYDQAQGQYQDFTGYSGPQNTQGQYGQTSGQLANGTQGEQGMGQIAGGYDQYGQYSGPNNASGQYGQNAASGPLAGQQFYNQQAGNYDSTGRYTDPNLAAGQYSQTQQAFGDLPIAQFDPFYDRARQLATQSYNQDAAGRGVYGSSEALSGVGNVITDIEAQRANRSFDAEMQRAQEQRARQSLLGEQARMGDLSSQAAFGANLAGLETFGNLANQAGNQTLGQQTMLGNQARQADLSQTDAFNANLAGAETFAGINADMGRLELDRNQLLGNMANAADSQALGAQQANISGLNAFGNIAGQADSAETNRYQASTSAMNQADRTGLDRMNSGVANAFRGDDSARADFTAQTNAANQAAGLNLDRTRLGADIANTASGNDLQRLSTFMQGANIAEGDRQARINSSMDDVFRYSESMAGLINSGGMAALAGNEAAFDDYWNTQIVPELQAKQIDDQKINAMRQDIGTVLGFVDQFGGDSSGASPRELDEDNPYD